MKVGVSMLWWSVVGLASMSSCAASNRYAYEELEACPTVLTEEQLQSGVVRCRALCSSYARDFAEFDAECKCRCAPAGGARPLKAKPWAPREKQTGWGGAGGPGLWP